MSNQDKQQLGLIPRFIRAEGRQQEINAAISRYEQQGIDIPWEWLEEQAELSLYLIRRAIKNEQ